MKENASVTTSSGNIFADIGIPDATTHLLKARIVIVIGDMMKQQKLNQTAAAARMSLAQPDLSKLLRGHFRGFSLERLLSFAQALGGDIEIKVRINPAGKASEGRMSFELV